MQVVVYWAMKSSDVVLYMLHYAEPWDTKNLQRHQVINAILVDASPSGGGGVIIKNSNNFININYSFIYVVIILQKKRQQLKILVL